MSLQQCRKCEKDLFGNVDSERTSLINYRKYNKSCKLVTPSNKCINLFSKIVDVCNFCLPYLCLRNNISKLLKISVDRIIPTWDFTCTEHDMLTIIKDNFIKFSLLVWVRPINDIINLY